MEFEIIYYSSYEYDHSRIGSSSLLSKKDVPTRGIELKLLHRPGDKSQEKILKKEEK